MADEKNLADQPAKEGKGEFSAQPAEEEKEQEQEQQPEGKQGEFTAEEEEDKKKKKSPGYTPYDWGASDNISDFMVDAFSGALSNWFIANLQWVGHYIDTGTRWVNKAMDGKAKNPQALSAENNNGKANGGNQPKPNTQNKDQNKGNDKNNAGRQGSFTAEAAASDRNNNRNGDERQSVDPAQLKRNEAKAKNTEKQYDKVKKNVSKRKYPKTPEGKNQEAFDKMTLDSLKKEVEYRKNVAKNPDFAQTPEGRKARAELVGDRRALAAMQKETGVDTKVTDGIIKNKSKAKKKLRGNKHTNANKKRSKISTKNFGERAKSNDSAKKSARRSFDRATRATANQSSNLKTLMNLRQQMNSAYRQKTNQPATREQTNTQVNAALNKRRNGRGA